MTDQIRRILPAIMMLGMSLSACSTMSSTQPQSIATIETAQSMADVKLAADNLAASYGAQNVLVVFDVDDTLLALSGDVGGVAWWDWQDDLPKGAPEKLGFNKRLAVASAMFALTDMELAEGETTIDVFKNLIAQNIPVYALTARGPDNRDATMRELHDQGLDFTTAPECGPPLCVKRGLLSGDNLIAPLARKRFGFAAGAKTNDLGAGTIKLSSRRNASIANGVMMVSGQNKGIMLRLLVDSLPRASRPKAIIFVDDSAKNVAAVKAASPAYHEELRIFHYTARTADQSDFAKSAPRKNQTVRDLGAMENTLCSVLKNQAQICDR